MRKAIISCLVGAICALVALLVLRHRDGSVEGKESLPDAYETVRQRNPIVVPTVRRSIVSRRAKPRVKVVSKTDTDDDDDADDSRTPEEKALAERIEKALDEEDLKAAIACADEAQRCRVVEIRQAMVDALGWFGEKALPELMPFLADADEDVRESAKDKWTMAVSSIDDEGVKIGIVELAMGILTDEDALEEISSEYIGVDEKLAVESLSRIITSSGSKEGVAKAMESYEFVTGEAWTDKEAAKRWIAEEYEPPQGASGDETPAAQPDRRL